MSAPTRPVIGVTCYAEAVDRSPWVAQHSAVLPHAYLRSVEQAGAVAVILPPRLDADLDLAGTVIDRIDGLLIAGGADVEATRYGAVPDPRAQEPRPDRDAWELALAEVACARDLPMLGICRGMQVLGVAAGGSMVQHIPAVVGHDEHSPVFGRFTHHPVNVVAGSTLHEVLGVERADVPTYHHQSVEPLSLRDSSWRITAWHPDGTAEAMEDPTGTFRLAVQWHAEEGVGPEIFAAFVDAARRR